MITGSGITQLANCGSARIQKDPWEPKISKLKGGYSANAGTLIFNSWLKGIDMCV